MKPMFHTLIWFHSNLEVRIIVFGFGRYDGKGGEVEKATRARTRMHGENLETISDMCDASTL